MESMFYTKKMYLIILKTVFITIMFILSEKGFCLADLFCLFSKPLIRRQNPWWNLNGFLICCVRFHNKSCNQMIFFHFTNKNAFKNLSLNTKVFPTLFFTETQKIEQKPRFRCFAVRLLNSYAVVSLYLH